MEHAQALLKSLYVMAMMVEARDAYTGGHLWRVSQFARLVAERMQLPPDEVARVALGGFLHDLGKVGVPDATLRKTHPSMGARMLAGRQLAAHYGLRWVLSRNGLGVTVRWPRRCA